MNSAKEKAPTASTVEALSEANPVQKESNMENFTSSTPSLATVDSLTNVTGTATISSAALVPVFIGTMQGQSVQLCDARTLHTFMGVLRDFTDWVKARIRKFGFIEGVDFAIVANLSSPEKGSSKARAQKLTDYHLTLDMAKELSMVENNAKGREARRYFMECEKQVLAALTVHPGDLIPVATPYAVLPGQTLTAEQADTLRSLLADFAGSMPLDLRGMILREGWSKLKSHFKTDYRRIHQSDFNEAISIISRHIAKWAPCDPKKKEVTLVDDKPKFSLLQKRWLVYFDCEGVECAKPVPVDAVVMTFDELVRAVENPGGWMLSNVELAKLAAASTKRLSDRLEGQGKKQVAATALGA